MKIILLSGGSGTRLWPLSNDSRAKQFLKVLENEETGEFESMLQRVYRHLLHVVKPSDIIIASNKSQVDMIKKQIGNIPIVIEPERRDTFPAISLSTIYLTSVLGVAADEVVGVVSVDTFVSHNFYEQLIALEQLVLNLDAQLGLVGVKPTYNSSKYGYLIPRSWNNEVMEVASFIEKPTETEAQRLIEQSAYWNSGVFAFSINLIIQKLQQLNMPLDYQSLHHRFKELPKKSFDYEMVEHLNRIIALTYDGYWKDLGTWNTLTEEMSQQVIGNVGLSDDCVNTHVVNELDLPVKVLGVSNAVVAVSSDGILVSDKAASSRMKDMLHEGLFSRPMFEEREWGWYRIIDCATTSKRETITTRVYIEAGKEACFEGRRKGEESWSIIEGSAILKINNEIQEISEGDIVRLNASSTTVITTTEGIEFVSVTMMELT